MRAFLPAWLLKRVAAALHRVAAALERFAPPAPDTAAMAELSALFPGAPGHWLAYVAARAPHLASRQDPQTDTADHEPATTQPFNAQPRPQAPPFAHRPSPWRIPVLLLRRARMAEGSPPPAADPPPAPSRAHLRLLPSQIDSVARAAPQIHDAHGSAPRGLTRPASGEAAHRTPEISLPAQLRPRRPDLHLVAPRDVQAEPMPCPAVPSARRSLRAVVHSWLAPETHTTLTRAPAAPDSQVVPGPAPCPPAEQGMDRPRDQERVWLHVVKPAKRAASVALAPRSVPRTPALGLRDETHPAWPALPPADETAPAAPVPPPRFDRLRREQEEGLWSA